MRMGKTGWAVCGLVIAMMIWGGSFIALKIAFRAYDPMVVMWGRMGVACLLFLPMIGRAMNIHYRSGDGKYFLLMGMFEPCLYFTFEAHALTYTSASQAGIITAMLPVLVAVAAWGALGEALSLKTLFGFILAVVGACVLSVSGGGTAASPNPVLGNFLEFLAMVSATCYAVVLKRLSHRYPALFLTLVQSVTGFVYFSLLLLLPGTRLAQNVDISAIAAILFLGSVVTFGAYFLYNYGVSRMPAGRATAFVSLIPVFAVIMGWLFLGERLSYIQFLSSGLILAGVYFTQA